MRDVRAVVLVVLAAGCATLAAGHWTSADRITAPAGGLGSDPRWLHAHRRLLEVAGEATDCVKRRACPLGSMSLSIDAPLQWSRRSDRPNHAFLCAHRYGSHCVSCSAHSRCTECAPPHLFVPVKGRCGTLLLSAFFALPGFSLHPA